MPFKSSHQDYWRLVRDPVSLNDATEREDVRLNTHPLTMSDNHTTSISPW
jgi:hypothetical protein